jgi:shikimate kinase
MKNNIIFTGFMGSGKTTVGEQLAIRQDYLFIDTDDMIAEKEGQAIALIFAVHGEDYFRKLERESLKILAAKHEERMVIATGGGLPLCEENRLLMKQLGTVIYLQASAAVIIDRLKDDQTRPLLNGADPEQKIRKLLTERDPIYRQVADYFIDTDDKSVAQIIDEIIDSLQ